jgi:hypothetical protein
MHVCTACGEAEKKRGKSTAAVANKKKKEKK